MAGTGFVAVRSAAQLRRRWILAAIALALVIGWWHPAGEGGPLAAFERASYDWRFAIRGAEPAPAGVAVLAIDDAALAKLGRFPLPRWILATVVRKLEEVGVAAIGVDLLLLEPEPPTDSNGLSPNDLMLRNALSESGRDVLGMALVFGAGTLPEEKVAAARALGLPVVERAQNGAAQSAPIRDILLPIGRFRDVSEVGHVNVESGADGILRQLAVALPVEDAYIPALPLVLAGKALGLGRGDIALRVGRELRLGDRRLAVDGRNAIELNHYGPRGTVATYSLLDVLEGKVGRRELADKVVLIGASAIGVGDTFATPFSRDVPGVEVLATALANILQGDVLVRDWLVRLFDAVVLLVLAAVAFLAANTRLLPVSLTLVVLIVVAWAVAALLAFLHFGWVVGVVEPIFGTLLVAAAVTGARFRAQRIESRRLASERANLVEYQSPMIAEALATGGALALEGKSQMTAIMFVDVVGYTLRSERLGPAGTVEFLRSLHRRLERAALAHAGLIEQFMGDGAMLIFGLPEPSPDDAASALACARDLLESIAEWNTELEALGEPPVRLRIGIHYGPVVVARLGGTQQRHMSVAGDTVNVASRLEQLARAMMTPILVSGAVVDATRARGREDLLTGFVPAAPQHIRGRSTPLPVWAFRTPVV